MKIFDFFKNIRDKIICKNRNNLLLDSPKNLYSDLLKSENIENILNNMPQDLSKIEKAYYIYLELGKIINENPHFVFTDRQGKIAHYNDTINDEFFGICKSISELYVSILGDDRIGINADLVKQHPDSPITHIDTILKIDGKNYIVNLISDLSRIKSSRRVNSFCFNLTKFQVLSQVPTPSNSYLKRLEQHYGKIDSLSREEIEQFDKKLGYSFFVPQFQKNEERGIYTEDTIELLKKDMEDPEAFKKYVLHGKNVPKEDFLNYKLDYIFENIDKFTNFKGNMNYLDSIRYYIKIAHKIFSNEEKNRIFAYAAIQGDDLSNIISIIKVKPMDKENGKNSYYLYSPDEKKYKSKTPEKMKEFVNGLDKNNLHIIASFDRYSPKDLNELEL